MGAMKARVVAAREAADEARRNYTGVTQPDEGESGSDRHTEALEAHSDLIRDAEWDELIDEGNMKERR